MHQICGLEEVLQGFKTSVQGSSSDSKLASVFILLHLNAAFHVIDLVILSFLIQSSVFYLCSSSALNSVFYVHLAVSDMFSVPKKWLFLDFFQIELLMTTQLSKVIHIQYTIFKF